MSYKILLRQNLLFSNGMWTFFYETKLDFIPHVGAEFSSYPRFDGLITNVAHTENDQEFIHLIELEQCDDFSNNLFNSDFLVENEEFKEFRSAKQINGSEFWNPRKGFQRVGDS